MVQRWLYSILNQGVRMSKTIILARHATAGDRRPNETDFKRPLLEQGRMEAAKMSGWLRSKIKKPNYILSSPAVRAQQTADIFALNTRLAPAKIIFEPALYNASADMLADAIRQSSLPESADTLLVIAHNPGISQLAIQCAADLALGHLPPCGMVLLNAGIRSWADFDVRHCSLLSLELP
jgi:phosphohistidine phosphatase